MTYRVAAALALGLAATTLSATPATPATAPAAAPAAAAAQVKVIDGCLKSRPEPGTEQKVKICYTIFKPAGATRRHRVPFLMHSHGWGGSRTTDPNSAGDQALRRRRVRRAVLRPARLR